MSLYKFEFDISDDPNFSFANHTGYKTDGQLVDAIIERCATIATDAACYDKMIEAGDDDASDVSDVLASDLDDEKTRMMSEISVCSTPKAKCELFSSRLFSQSYPCFHGQQLSLVYK